MTDSKNEEAFEDANETAPKMEMPQMDLDTAMREALIGVNYFFNNRFAEAKSMMQPWAEQSVYHALGYGTITFLQAIMTFDPKDIEIAIESMKKSVDTCNKQRRKTTITNSIGKMVKQMDYNLYTEDEMHAELCYGECLLMRAVLTFFEDETLMSFVKGSLKIRSCFHSYRECWQILQHRDLSKDKHTIHFESGVRMGVGAFNLMMTQVPGKILRLLEFVGFTPHINCKIFGLHQLELGFKLDGSLRQVLCALVLLGYHLFASYTFGTSHGDTEAAEKILNHQLKLYPEGALFLFFKARLSLVKGKFTLAADVYNQSRLCQVEWKQFHHICYWELYWCALIKGFYKEAENCADVLMRESKWSKATYAYMKACCLFQRKDTLSQCETEEMNANMRKVPELKQKIAGKSLPIEKFAAKKALRYYADGESLTLPCLELLYIWNYPKIISRSKEDIQRIYFVINKEINYLESIPVEERSVFYWDKLFLCYLLKGSCLKFMDAPLLAMECFTSIVNNAKNIYEDNYLLPFSFLEISLLHYNEGDYDLAKQLLDHAKNVSKSYMLESRLLFRVHSTMNQIKAKQKKKQKFEEEESKSDVFYDVSEANPEVEVK